MPWLCPLSLITSFFARKYTTTLASDSANSDVASTKNGTTGLR